MDVDKYQTKFSRVSPSEQQENNNTPDNSKPNHLERWHHSSRIIRVSRASGGKDRHSKVWTSKGLRDRRVRLSVTTAIQFYDLQDRLGFDQPSKAVEWLIKAAADSIAELPSLNDNFPPDQCQNSNSDTSKGSTLSISRENARVKARERARERTLKEREREIEREKDKEKESDGNYIYNDSSSFTELLTGGFKGGEEGKSWPLTPIDYTVSSSKTSQFFNQQLPFGDSSHCGSENLPQFPFADPIIGADYNLNFTISPTHGGLNRGTLQSNSHHQTLRTHFQRPNAHSSAFASPSVDAAGNFLPFLLGAPAPETQFSSPGFHFLYGDGNKGKGKN